MTPEELFRAQLASIQRIIRDKCRKSRFSKEDCEDFHGRVMVKLIRNDYAILRNFDGMSSIQTYLTVVIQRECSDYRDHLWGKWRPSKVAQRLGAAAVKLEELVIRDGLEQGEAVGIIRGNPCNEVEEKELERILAELPARTRRSFESESRLEELQTQMPDPEQELLEREEAEEHYRQSRFLSDCLERLSEEDRLLVKMHFEDGVSLASIARSFDCNQRSLYTRMDRIKRKIGSCMQKLHSASKRIA